MAELVLALDVPDRQRALATLALVPGARWIKIGSVLYTAAGPALVETVRDQGRSVFLDLKWHDIPNTVRGAVRAARKLGVRMVTVHALGGVEMLQAAKEAAGDLVAVVAVTVLTSHRPVAFGELMGRPVTDLTDEVERFATMAMASGLDGVVCSPLEAAALRRELGPAALIVTPGIRSGSSAPGDQARVATAAAAVRAGATHLVVGRPVLEAADPERAWAELVLEAGS